MKISSKYTFKLILKGKHILIHVLSCEKTENLTYYYSREKLHALKS